VSSDDVFDSLIGTFPKEDPPPKRAASSDSYAIGN